MKRRAVVEKVLSDLHDKSSTPMILDFKNGQMINKRSSALNIQIKGKQESATVVVNNDVYVGTNNHTKLGKLCLCVRNKTTEKVTIIPITQTQMNNEVHSTRTEQEVFSKLSNDNALKLMLKKYGGKGASRFSNDLDNMKINVNVLKEEINASVDAANVVDKVVDVKDYYDSMRPKFDENATRIEDIYNIEDVISTEVLTHLNEEADTIFNTDVKELGIESNFICTLLQETQKSKSTPEALQKVKLIVYMDAILNFATTKGTQLKNKQISLISHKIGKEILNRFGNPNTKTLERTRFGRDKAICYFIVLALLINGNAEVNMNTLCEELHISRQKLILYAQLVNAMPKSKTDVLRLRLPSKTPPLKNTFRGTKK